ncbi:hypothetical protein QW060_17165 [Myroides ceti]|uniref:Uncharacterized protein n=1 Tax=Paenimyroides ceti TaxID=395087 RepID=A0ABT8CYW6_9FLAO|nr:hypothetical protein [Paenimyroides ceti]MDN3708833.1 hypothetical protein [Paenimyroides ceti]
MSQTKHSLINFIVHGAGQIVNLLAPFIVMPYLLRFVVSKIGVK